MDKETLRKLFLRKRKELTPGGLDECSGRITRRLATLSFNKVQYVHLFYPIPGKGEVDTIKIAHWLKETHGSIKLVLSRVNKIDNTLAHILWEDETPLAMNSWGITEPAYGEEIRPELLDIILIPLLAFDRDGNRIGYGKGFYDRFLAQCRPDALKVGLSCFDPVEETFDVDQFDVPLNLCVTPERIWYF